MSKNKKMTRQELEIRRQINSRGYKLKGGGHKYWIKGYPGGKSFKGLQEIEIWINKLIEKEEEEKRLYEERIAKLNANAIFPTYKEEYKKCFWESIREHGVEDTIEDLEKIFDENSELYKSPFVNFDFDIENILSNINDDNYRGYGCPHNDLGSMVYSDLIGLYYYEVKQLNPGISDDDSVDLPDNDPYVFYNDIIEQITVDELKEFIFKMKKEEIRSITRI